MNNRLFFFLSSTKLSIYLNHQLKRNFHYLDEPKIPDNDKKCDEKNTIVESIHNDDKTVKISDVQPDQNICVGRDHSRDVKLSDIQGIMCLIYYFSINISI